MKIYFSHKSMSHNYLTGTHSNRLKPALQLCKNVLYVHHTFLQILNKVMIILYSLRLDTEEKQGYQLCHISIFFDTCLQYPDRKNQTTQYCWSYILTLEINLPFHMIHSAFFRNSACFASISFQVTELEHNQSNKSTFSTFTSKP